VTVWGWDASDFDWSRGSMDLTAAARDGIQLFTHKATESTGIKHVHYGEALQRARAAGIELLGAYHVVRSTDVVRAGPPLPRLPRRADPVVGTAPGLLPAGRP
jgi:hypothetical protein